MLKLDLEKAEEPEIKLPTSPGSLKKQENSRKKKEHYLITHTEAKEIFLHKANRAMYIYMCVYVYVYIQAGSKLRKEYIKTLYCHPAYLTSMRSTS